MIVGYRQSYRQRSATLGVLHARSRVLWRPKTRHVGIPLRVAGQSPDTVGGVSPTRCPSAGESGTLGIAVYRCTRRFLSRPETGTPPKRGSSGRLMVTAFRYCVWGHVAR